MKIAVTYEDGEIFQHFGHTKQFKIYEFDYADKVVLLNKKVLKNGTPEQVLSSAEFMEEFKVGMV